MTAGAALVLVYGTVVLLRLPVDVLPDLNRPTVTVMAEAGGLAPEEVELLVTRPIEIAMNGAPGVERVRSSSAVGLSIVWVEFGWESDLYLARQLVGERLQLAREVLPEGVSPSLGPVTSIMGEILLVGLVSEGGGTSPMALRTLADWTVRQRLMTIAGVAQVIPIGGEVVQIQARVRPERLAALDVSLEDVAEAVRQSQGVTTGGFVELRSQEVLVRNVARTSSVEELRETVVAWRDGTPIRLGDVAAVEESAAVKRGDASVNGGPAVILSVQKQPGASTVELTSAIEAALGELAPSLPPDVRVVPLFRQASFIERAVGNVVHALRDGALLVVLVLFVFLANFRTTAITLTAIPLSFVGTALVFRLFGLSIDTMTLGGLAIAIGELVDDAIVDVENVFRRLRENAERPPEARLPAFRIVRDASVEVRGSIVFATIIVVLVFLPLFSLSSIEGRIFAPLGIAYVVSILASLVVSLTVTPALAAFLLPRARATEKPETRVVRRLKAWDRSLVSWALDHPGPVLGGAGAAVALAVASVPFLGAEFLPPFNEGTATVSLLAPPGTSLQESNRLGTLAERLVLGVPEVVSTGRRTGRAEMDEHAEGVHSSEIDVDLRPSDRSREEILADLRSRLEAIPGVVIGIGQPISHRIDHLLSGVRAQVAVKVFGADLEAIRTRAEDVRAAMAEVPGVVDVRVEAQVEIPQIRIRPRPEAAQRYGVRPGELVGLLETALQGRVVGQVLEGERTIDLLVRFEERAREDADALRDALVETPSGARVPLRLLADVVEGSGPNVIQHENARRRIVVGANVSGRDLAGAVEDVQARIGALPPAPGTYITFGGQFESQIAASRLIAILSLVSLAGMILVLHAHFRSMRIVLQVLLNIPLALVGSVAAIWLTERTFSVASLVAFVTLAGIASRNTIMMISHYLHLVRHEGETFDRAMIVRGSQERLVPVLMTALTAALALLPLLLSRGEPGREILHPVAVVVFGGIVSSTLLDVIVTPVAFWVFGRKDIERLAFEESEAEPWMAGAPAGEGSAT